MPTAKQQAVIEAQNKFFAAQDANAAAQAASSAAYAVMDKAHFNMLQDAPAQAAAIIKTAQDAYLAAVTEANRLGAIATEASRAEGQAKIDYDQAITDSRMTGGGTSGQTV